MFPNETCNTFGVTRLQGCGHDVRTQIDGHCYILQAAWTTLDLGGPKEVHMPYLKYLRDFMGLRFPIRLVGRNLVDGTFQTGVYVAGYVINNSWPIKTCTNPL